MHTLKNMVNLKSVMDRIANAKKVASLKDEIAAGLGVDVKEIKAEIHNVEHHRSHMACAFFASDFEESAILSVDGFGDFTSTMIGIGRGNQMEVLDSVIYPHSIGIFYTAFTQWLGFPHYGDEYKVMGLAPYGKPEFMDKIWDVIHKTDDGLFKLNEKYFSHVKHGVSMNWENGAPEIEPLFNDYFVEKFGPVRQKGEKLTDYHTNIATSVQRVTEEIIFHILTHLHKKTGIKNICITGGVAQNSVANGKIKLNTPFENIYIPSAGHDAGTCIGSALYAYNQILKMPRAEFVRTAYLGSEFSDDQIETYVKTRDIKYLRLTEAEIVEKTAQFLADGKVIGWYQGAAEFGPRALGNRSILVDPGRDDAKDLLNEKVKKREPFRPFAPSILREHVSVYFEQEDDVFFMEKVFKIKEEKRKMLPAVTHVDGTGRLQTVHKDVAPKYYALIEAFGKKSGYPIILNTSFNENEPIVNTPHEAFECFMRTTMDVLVMGNIIIER